MLLNIGDLNISGGRKKLNNIRLKKTKTFWFIVVAALPLDLDSLMISRQFTQYLRDNFEPYNQDLGVTYPVFYGK